MAKPKAPRKNKASLASSTEPKNVELKPESPVEAASVVEPSVPVTASSAEIATEKKIKPRTTRKPEIVRGESRASVLPINLDEEIRQLAYLMSERRGFAPGHEAEDWIAAELEIRQRYNLLKAKGASA